MYIFSRISGGRSRNLKGCGDMLRSAGRLIVWWRKVAVVFDGEFER
jgi:hypothetical protein